MLATQVMAEAVDKQIAFGKAGEQGEVERAMAISKMQGNTTTQ